jgi:hypothetical protein
MQEAHVSEGLRYARLIIQAEDAELPRQIRKLLHDRELHPAVHSLNALLDHQDHRAEAMTALKRIGLWDCG